jgi:hypothetical protein
MKYPKGWIRHCSLGWDKLKKPARTKPASAMPGSMIHRLVPVKRGAKIEKIENISVSWLSGRKSCLQAAAHLLPP